MIYVECVLLLFSISLIIKSPRNKYTYFFALMTMSLLLMIFTTIPQWKYDYTNMWLFRLDYKLLLEYSNNYWKYLNLRYYDMLDLFNIAMVIYMVSLQLFVYDCEKNSLKIKKYIKKLLFGVFCIAYLLFFNSETALNIYLKLNTSGAPLTEKISIFIVAVNSLFLGVQTFYILSPPLKLLIKRKKEDFWPKQRQMFVLGICTLVMSIFVLCFFVFGPLRNNYIEISPDNLLGIRHIFRLSTYHYIILVFTFCVFILGMLYVIFKARVLFAFSSIRRKLFKNRWSIDVETREIFHMFKNILFNIEAIAMQAMNSESTEEKDKRLKLISDLCENRINDFFAITSVSKRTDYVIMPVQTGKIIDEAIKRVSFSKDVKIEYEYLTNNDLIHVDFVSMTEAIANIFKNANEAFENIERENKIITVKVRSDHDMVAIDIIDNGKGINKKEFKKINKPLYTTKNRKNNWGVGLAFVYKTIFAHCGHIRINSIEGKGTCVSIILYREGAYRLWKK